MQASKRFTVAIILLFLVSGSFFLGFYTASQNKSNGGAPKNLSDTSGGISTDANFAPFWKTWTLLENKFAGTTTPSQERVWGAIKGLTASFGDPYTVFMPPEEAKIFKEEINGNFEGVGMEVGLKDGRITVVAPLKDTPAEKAGIKSGDKIISIDEVSTDDMPIDKAIKLIRGKAGTSVELLVERIGANEPLKIKLTRAVINIPTIRTSVKTETSDGTMISETGLREDGVFVIELYSFSANSANLFRNALKEFIASGSNKLVLDLRGNPGGYLDASIDMASWFLPIGKTVLIERFGKGGEERIHRSKGFNVFGKDLKMIILVNGGSASASEILAGALSENGVAKLVGTKTFGKGSVQELVQITDDTNLKVTVAKWFTPSGISISDQGITPEYVVDFKQEDVSNKHDPQMDKAIELLTN